MADETNETRPSSGGNFNQATFIGRLTADPVLRRTNPTERNPQGIPLCTFTVACNRVFTSGGTTQKRVHFQDCVQWGPRAEATARYLRQGRLVMVQGMVSTRSYTSKQFHDISALRELLSGSTAKSLPRAKVEEALEACAAASLRTTELEVHLCNFLDSPPRRQADATAVQDALPHPEDVEVEVEDVGSEAPPF